MGTQISAVELQKLEIAPIAADGGAGTEFEEVPVVHEATFTYEDSEPEAKDYKDVKGNVYFRTKKPGVVKMNASIGRYDLETKAKLQGGKYTAGAEGKPGSWVRPDGAPIIEYTVRGTTLDGVRITFPRAEVSASGKANDQAIGLSLVFTALKPTKAGVPVEIWEDGVDETPAV